MLNSHFLHFLKRSERISTGKSCFLKDLNLQLSAICYFFQLKFQSSQRIQAKEPSENNRGFNPRHLWFILMMIMLKQETKQINFYKCQCCNHCAAAWKSLFFTFEQRKFTLGSISHKMNEKKMEDWCQPHVDHFQIPASVSHSFVFDPHTSSKVFVYIKVIPADSIIQQDKMFERKQVVKETVGGFVTGLCHAIKQKITLNIEGKDTREIKPRQPKALGFWITIYSSKYSWTV